MIERDSRKPLSKDILYFISTTSNYNVFEDITVDVKVNLIVLLEVLENLDKDCVFNFVSSWFVYGDTRLPATEDSYCDPKGFYSITKRAAEQLVTSYCETHGIKYRILRLCNVYGKGDQGASKKKNALQFLVNEIADNKPINLYYDGDFYRDYMHVDDVARAIDLCISTGPLNEIVNIGTGEKTRFGDLIDIVFKETGSKSEVTAIDAPPFHKMVQSKDFYMKVEKLKALGFKPQISLEEGIKSLCH